MEKRILVAVILSVFLAASACAQITNFFELVETGTPQDVQAAIDKGADLSARDSGYGLTPLIAAAEDNPDPEVIAVLLKAGADIEARDSVHGGTALLWAATWNRNPEVITTLLKAGADINAQNTLEGRTALLWAAYQGVKPAEAIGALLKAGANAKVRDKAGFMAVD